MVLAATLAHAHRWHHFTPSNLCCPYLCNPLTDFTAAHTGDTTPDGHELQWSIRESSNGPLENPWLMKWKQGKQYVAGHPWSGPPTPDPYLLHLGCGDTFKGYFALCSNKGSVLVVLLFTILRYGICPLSLEWALAVYE